MIAKRELVAISLGLAVSVYLVYAKLFEFNVGDYLVAENDILAPYYSINLSSLGPELQIKSESNAELEAMSGFANAYGIVGSVLVMLQILKTIIESLQKAASYSKQRFFQPAKPVDEEAPLLINSSKNKQLIIARKNNLRSNE